MAVPVDLTQGQRDAIAACVVDRWVRLKNARTQKEYLWQESIYAFDCKFGETWGEIADNRSHRYIPIAFQTVETAVAQYLQGTMPNDRFFKVLGRTPTDQYKAGSQEALLRWQMYRTDFRQQYFKFLKMAATTGNVPWTIQWRTEQTPVPDREAMQMAQMSEMQFGPDKEFTSALDSAGTGFPSKMATTFEGPSLVVGDIFNFVIDRAPDDPRQAFRIYRTLQTAEFIRNEWGQMTDSNGEPLYKDLDRLQNGMFENRESSDALKKVMDSAMGFQPLPKDRCELLTFCGDLVLGAEYGEPTIYRNVFGVIGNRQFLLRFGTNPHAHGLPPWQMFGLIPDPQDMYGYSRGVIEPMLGIQDLVNVRANQSADANAIAINPPLAVVADGITNTRQIVWGPGETLFMRAPQNIIPMNVNHDAMQLGLQEINFYMGQAGLTSGVQGQVSSAGGDASATEVAGIQAQGNARLTETLRHIEGELVRMIRIMCSMNQQLMDPNSPIIVRLFQDESGVVMDPYTGEPLDPTKIWAEISAESIQGEFDFEVLGANATSQNQQQIRDKIQLYSQISQDPRLSMYLRPGPFLKSLLENAKWPDAYQFIKSEQEVQYEMAQQAALEQQQSMANGGNAGAKARNGRESGHSGVPSLPGKQGGGGDAARTPYPEQLAGPSRMG